MLIDRYFIFRNLLRVFCNSNIISVEALKRNSFIRIVGLFRRSIPLAVLFRGEGGVMGGTFFPFWSF